MSNLNSRQFGDFGEAGVPPDDTDFEGEGRSVRIGSRRYPTSHYKAVPSQRWSSRSGDSGVMEPYHFARIPMENGLTAHVLWTPSRGHAIVRATQGESLGIPLAYHRMMHEGATPEHLHSWIEEASRLPGQPSTR